MLIEKVLQLVVPKNALNGMTQSAKLQRVYQCTLEDGFADISAETLIQQSFSQILALQRQERPRPESWGHSFTYFKEMFITSSICSLPLAVFDACTSEAGNTGTFLSEGGDPWAESLAMASLPPCEFDPSVEIVLFEVANNKPEARKLVATSHIREGSRMNVVKLHVVIKDAATPSFGTMPSDGRVLTFYFEPLVASLATALPHLFVWKRISELPVRLTRLVDQPTALPDDADRPLLPAVAGVESTLALIGEPGSLQVQLTLSERNLADNFVAASFRLLDRLAEAEGWVDVMDVGIDFDMSVIDELVRIGVVSQQVCCFGRLSLRARLDMLRWSVLHRVGKPMQLTHLESTSVLSKLGLVIALRRDGWENGACAEDWKPGLCWTGSRWIASAPDKCCALDRMGCKAFRDAIP